jgi:hypothetical protein
MIIRYKSPRAQPHEVLTVYPVHSEYVVRVPAPYNGRTSRLTLPFLFLLLSQHYNHQQTCKSPTYPLFPGFDPGRTRFGPSPPRECARPRCSLGLIDRRFVKHHGVKSPSVSSTPLWHYSDLDFQIIADLNCSQPNLRVTSKTAIPSNHLGTLRGSASVQG